MGATVHSNDPRLRVFISSVIDAYEAFRAAAAQGVEDAGGEPVMVERLPSLTVSPRNACLDGVGASDVYLVLIGARAGWTTPGGAVATEEEFDEAARLARPVLVFIQDVKDRETRAAQFARRVCDYVGGRFRTEFTDTDGLRSQVAAAVRAVRRTMDLPLSDPSRVLALLGPKQEQAYGASVRLALVTERAGEIVSPERLESPGLLRDLYEIGHERNVHFFDYSASKEPHLSRDGALAISQRSEHGRERSAADLLLSESGELVLETAIASGGGSDSMLAFSSITEKDLQAALGTEFAFAAHILDALDPHERYSALWAGAAIFGAEHCYLYRNPPSSRSRPIRTGDAGPVVAEKKPRKVARAQLRSGEAEIQRLISLFRRLLGAPNDR